MKKLQKRTHELQEAGCDFSEAKEILEKEFARPLTRPEMEFVWEICGA
jgi:hypothetical protein